MQARIALVSTGGVWVRDRFVIGTDPNSYIQVRVLLVYLYPYCTGTGYRQTVYEYITYILRTGYRYLVHGVGLDDKKNDILDCFYRAYL